MTAKEAREMSLKCRIPDMRPVFQSIQDAAMQGKMHVSVDITGQLTWGIQDVILELEKQGYNITDKDNRDKLKINWRKQNESE